MTTHETAEVARLFADPSRAAMLDVLLDGSEHPIGRLAAAAGIAAPTATEHLAQLEVGGLVTSRRAGRQRLVRLSGSKVASAYEALGQLTEPAETNGLRAWTRREQLRAARTCYDHLAGRLGVAIADAALAAGALTEDFAVAPAAEGWFAQLGVDLEHLERGRRPLLRVCVDWTERREHLAGALGAAVCSATLRAGWTSRRPGSRALRVTPLGGAELRRLGIAGDLAT